MKSLEEVHESSQSQLESGKAKKWFHPGSNRGPSLRESDVITNYTMKPLNIRPLNGKIIVGEKKKKEEGREERKGRIRKGKKERE